MNGGAPGSSAADIYRRFESFRTGSPIPPWPPALEDPFPGVRGVPSVDPADLDPQTLGGAILHHGCLRVPGLFAGPAAERLREAVVTALDAGRRFLDTRVKSDWFSPFPTMQGTVSNPSARWFVREGGSVYAADSPLAFGALLEEFARTGISRVIEGYLGEQAYLSVGKTSLRRVDPGIPTGWHQDGAFLGEHVRTVNLWIALTDCGEEAPGLDLLPRRVAGLCERGTQGAHFDWSIGDPVVQALAQDTKTPIESPAFSAGDALLFDQLFVHRTGIHPGMTRARYAIEAWHFAGSTFPAKQIPISLHAGDGTAGGG